MGDVRPEDWDALARRTTEPQFQEQIAYYKRQENLALIAAWAPPQARSLLKTDLFEEGFGKDSLLDALAEAYPVAVGMDISGVVTAAAKGRVPAARYVVSDACALPFKAERFDLIVSISTLDHLLPESLPHALGELCRVLRPAGCLILTLDSGHNPLHVLSHPSPMAGADLRRAVLHGRRADGGAGAVPGAGGGGDRDLPRAVSRELPGEESSRHGRRAGRRVDSGRDPAVPQCRRAPHAILHRAVHRAPHRQECREARASHSVAAVSGFLKRVLFQMAEGRDWLLPPTPDNTSAPRKDVKRQSCKVVTEA